MTAGTRMGLRTPTGKVSVPRPPRGAVPRERCRQALAASVATHRLVLVSAPAGYGKTTLIADWATTVPDPVAWVSLDPLDDDPGRLTQVVADAVAAAWPASARGLPGDAEGTVAQRVDALVGALEQLPAGRVVVLDDVHQLSAATARQVLGPLLRYPGPRYVLAGRHDTALPVNRMRLSGDVGELRERALAFTEPEVAEVARAQGGAADAETVRALYEVTRGWPVAVRLALAAAGADGDRPLHGLRDRDVPIAGYLVEEVIGRLPDALADFVLRAAVARTVDPVLADALAPGGARLLQECVARGLFLTEVPGGEPGPQYRWHELVAAHATALLARRDPAAARAAHRTVAAHLGPVDPATAIRHALDGQAPELAATILGERWPELVVRGDVGDVQALRAVLPTPFRGAPDVQRALSAAAAFTPGPDDADHADPDHADPDHAEADRADADHADPDRADAPRPAAVGALVRTFLTTGRPPLGEAVRSGRALLDAPGLDDATRALGLYLVGRAELLQAAPGRTPDGEARLARGAALAAGHGWSALELGCRAEQALAAAYRGEVVRARSRARTALAAAAARGWEGTSVVAAAHLACGLAAYWCDELDAAWDQLTQALECAGCSRPELAMHAAAFLAVACLARGDAAGLTRARAVVDAPWTAGGAPEYLRGLRALLAAMQLDAEQHPARALALVELAAAEDAPGFGHPLALCWQSDLRRRLGDVPGAWRVLHAAEEATERAGAPGVRPPAPARVATEVGAAVLLAADDPGAAHAALERALGVAAQEGVVRPLRDRAPALHPLLSEHLEWGSAHEALVARLLVAEEVAPAPRASAWDLTPRERDVLACLRSSLTADEIAESLFLSVNTVKTHMRAIYRKLGVDGRRSAVREAVQRGML